MPCRVIDQHQSQISAFIIQCNLQIALAMPQTSLKLKVALYLIIALSAGMGLFTYLIVQHQQEELRNEVSRHVTQISEVVVKSTRHAMLMNEREMAGSIIDEIAKQHGIEEIRLITADGTIVHSKDATEMGRTIDKAAMPCVKCHQTSTPLKSIPNEANWTTYKDSRGKPLLGTMQVIRNEPSCSSASCHEHPSNQSVLGIVDIAFSLEEITQRANAHASYLVAISIAFICLIAASIVVLLARLIYRPLQDLRTGSESVAKGDLTHRVPVRNHDEFGNIAQGFNLMTTALQKAETDRQAHVDNLELEVQERTRKLRLAEAEVAQGEKLASIGLLASGIAHELNSPLTGVLTFASLLRKKLPDTSQDAQDLDLVISETKRCANIIRRLLDFAREKIPARAIFNLNQLIEETVELVERNAALQGIRITMNLEPALPLIWGDADLLKQVLVNILVNAEQAIARNGEINVTSRLCADATPDDTGNADLPMVEVEISDTGCGISEANLPRIFDPFFTSKEVGKGTGLGLSVSYGIIKGHGGSIGVESVVNTGTKFRIALPVDLGLDRSTTDSDKGNA